MSLTIYLIDGKCPYCDRGDVIFRENITHNLVPMAQAAGVYEVLWRPEEKGIKRAGQIIDILREGLNKLKENPEYYKGFNPPNKWGSYEGLVSCLESYLSACELMPETHIEVSR